MSGPVAIRPGGEEDLDAVARIAVDSWRSTGLARDGESSTAERRGRFAQQMTEGCLMFVAERDGAAVGFVLFDPSTGYLAQLFVAPEHQAQGVGSALFTLARHRMAGETWLKTPVENRRAIAWYERRGFVKAREIEEAAGGRVVAFYRRAAGG